MRFAGKLPSTLLTFLFLLSGTVHAGWPTCNCKGKIDVAPAYVHIDILQSENTIKTLDLFALKVDSTVMIFDQCGFSVKPSLLYGGSKDGRLFTAGLGIGYYFPITKMFALTPTLGCNYTYLKAEIPVEFFGSTFDLQQKFNAWSPYIGLEAHMYFSSCWRACAVVQYSKSYSRTKIESLGTSNERSQGPNYAILLERDINKQWSVNIGAAYNISLSHEKHGLRGWGVKLGTAYWF